MMQQINLYLPELRPKKEWLTANTLVWCLIGALVLSSLFSYMGQAHNQELEKSVVELENLQSLARAQVESMKSMARPRNIAEIDEKIRSLRSAISDREKVGQIIEYQNLGNAEGFSEAMEAIALHSMKTISLSQFSFLEGGRFLSLKGKTSQPKDIATYIDLLSEEPSFSQTQFGSLGLSESEQTQKVHEFSLGDGGVYQVATKEKENHCLGSSCNEF